MENDQMKEFEEEAQRAFDKIVRSAEAVKAEDVEDDEFADAFQSDQQGCVVDNEFATNRVHSQQDNAAVQIGKVKSSMEKHPPKSSNQLITGSDSEKEIGSKNVGIKENTSSEYTEKPPLPEFAVELFTRHTSQTGKGELLSPTHSVKSAQSNESSERGWSSDPDAPRLRPQQSLSEAKEEWEKVETVTAGTKSAVSKSPFVTFPEAIFHFKSANLDEFAASIKPTLKHTGIGAIWHAIAGPPKIHNRLQKDRDLIFTLGLCPFDNLDPMHIMILQTIYKRLTATNLDCPRYGQHWESIGFQGEDPATDLRGCGMLGLLTTLDLISNQSTQSLAFDIYRLSEDEVQNFPFCVMGINITRITLQIFREQKLNKECNKRGQVFEIFIELYCSIYYHIYQIWKFQHKTIRDSGFVIQEVEKAARKNPTLVMRNFQKALRDRKNAKKLVDVTPASKHGNTGLERVDKFAGVCDLETNEEVDVHLV